MVQMSRMFDKVIILATYKITKSLSHVTINNSATTIKEGSSYTATLSASSGYSIDTVTIKMGGVDITSSAYSSSTKKINIVNVTGDITITATTIKIVTLNVGIGFKWGDDEDCYIDVYDRNSRHISKHYEQASGIRIYSGYSLSCWVRGNQNDSINVGYVEINGVRVFTNSSTRAKSYEWTVPDNISTVNVVLYNTNNWNDPTWITVTTS